MTEKIRFSVTRQATAVVDEYVEYQIDKDVLFKIMDEEGLSAQDAAYHAMSLQDDTVHRLHSEAEVKCILDTHEQTMKLNESLLEVPSPQ